LLFCFLAFDAFSQHESIERHFNTYLLRNHQLDSTISYEKDTCLRRFHEVELFYKNSLHGGMIAGNINQAFLDFNFFDRNNHQFIFLSPYLHYTTQTEEILFFDARKPFSRFDFTTGAKDFEQVNGLFTANPTPFVNFGLKYLSTKTGGNYIHSAAKIKDFVFWQSYTKKRYQNYISFVHNSISNEEFGGIANDSVFESGNQRIENLAVNLTNASLDLKHQEISFTHELKLGKLVNDTIINLEDTAISSIHQGKFSLVQNIKLTRNWRIYSDVPSEFYSNIYRDSLNTFDSISQNSFTHSTGINYFHRGNKSIGHIFLGFLNRYTKFHLPIGDDLIQEHNLITNAEFSTQKLKNNTNAELGIYGYNKNDWSIRNKLTYQTDRTSKNIFVLTTKFSQETPNFFLQKYASNNFEWNNNFHPTFTINNSICFIQNPWQFKVFIRHAFLLNSIFITESGVPEQLNSQVNIINPGISKAFYLGHFGINASLGYQYVDYDETIKLPQLLIYTGIFYENNTFSDNLKFRIGIDTRYHSDFTGYNYIPATGFFAVQNEENITMRPLTDVYLNFKVKRFRAFLRYSNVGQSFFNMNDFALTHYPIRPGGLHFGFTWEFYD
jgi:hypothetical protein